METKQENTTSRAKHLAANFSKHADWFLMKQDRTS